MFLSESEGQAPVEPGLSKGSVLWVSSRQQNDKKNRKAQEVAENIKHSNICMWGGGGASEALSFTFTHLHRCTGSTASTR